VATGGELDSIVDALGLTAGADQRAMLARYLSLLQRWNAVYNLTAVRDRSAMLVHHLADCLAVVRPVAARLEKGRVLDVGSGGGLPGVVLAVMAPNLEVTCVDAVGKKAAFVRQVAVELRLSNVFAHHARAEAWRCDVGFDLVVSRGLSTLGKFVELTREQLNPGGAWLAMKGQIPAEELATLPPDVDAFHVEQLAVPGLRAHRCLVWMQRARSVRSCG
jgi:16S rRNA (guanine527-N7)-methyltransferase